MATRMQQRRGTATQWADYNPILSPGEIGYESDTNKFKIGDGINHWVDLDYFIDENALGTTLGDYVETSLLGVANGVATLNSSGVLETSQLPALAISDTTVVADQTARLALTAQVGDVAIQTDNGTTYILAASPASTNSNWKEVTATAATDAAITAERSATATLTNKTLTSPKLNENVAVTSTATELNILDGATISTTELNYLNGVTSSIQDQLNSKLASANLAEAAQDAVNTALIAGTGLDKTYDDNANTITLDIDSTVATKTYADDAVSTHNSDTTSVHGISDTAELATKTFAAELLTNATKTNIVITGDKNGLTITAENGVADSTTDNLTEGTTNKYFTDERAQDAVGNAVGTGLSYNDSTGAISVTANTYDAYGSASTVQSNLDDHASDTGTHGVGEIVGASETQTLTNKTLTSPKINENVALTATATELNVLDGITASTAELNILDGATLSTTELNYVDGVTSSIQTQLNNKQDKVSGVSDTEIGYLDGVTSGIQSQLDAKLALSGGTMSGALTLSGAPTSDLHAATKLYVDNVTAGINFHQAVHVATTTNLNADYNNGTNGVGATLTASSNGTWTTLDGHSSFTQYDRILVKDQTDSKQNGIYVLSDLGSGSSKWILTRATDADNNPSGEMKNGDFVLVLNGDQSGFGFVNNSSANPIAIGTDNITYVPFNAAKAVSAGNGLQEATPGVLSIDTTITQTRVSGVSDTEIGYLDGVTSGIQGQLNAKAPLASPTFTGTVTLPSGTVTSAMIANGTIVNDDISATAAIDWTKLAVSSTVSSTELGYLDGVTSAIQTQIDGKISSSSSDTLSNKSISLGSNTVTGTISQFNTALTDADFATLAGSETLTNKTITLGSNTVSGTLAQFNTAVTDADLASLAGSETLTNKTIALGSNTVSGTIAQFNTALTDGDFATLAGSETLTNKTISSGTLTGTLTAGGGVGSSGQYLESTGTGVRWTTVTGYSAPTIGSTSIASGATVTTIAGLTLTAPTLTGTVTASGDINLSAVNGPGSLIDELNLLMMGAL